MTHKTSVLPLFKKNFGCRLNRRFWRSKKVVQVVQIGGRKFGQNPNEQQQREEKKMKEKKIFSPIDSIPVSPLSCFPPTVVILF